MAASSGSVSQVDALGTAPVGPLYAKMSLPIVLSMLVNGSYNLVDAAFVTRGIGPVAMGGVALAFPLHMLLYSCGALIGNGAASIVSRMLGASNARAANAAALGAIALGFMVSVLLAVAGLAFLEPVLLAFGATEALLPHSREFLTPLLWGAPVVLLSTVFAELLRAEGKAAAMAGILMLSTVANIVFAAVFVFVLKSGVSGVACGTLLAQGLGLVVAVSLYLRRKTVVALRPVGFSFDSKLFLGILALGLPALIGNGGIALTVALANRALAAFSGDADLLISAYGVVSRLSAFVQLPLIGLMIGYQTIVGYNYGAQRLDRVRQMVRVGILTATVYCVFCSGLLLLIPDVLLRIFTADEQLVERGTLIARAIFLTLGLAGVSIMGAALFQALGKAKSAMFLSTIKVFCVLAPLLVLLPPRFGISGVWYAFPISDGVVFLIVAAFLSRQYASLRRAEIREPSRAATAGA